LVGFKKGIAEKNIIIRELKENILMVEEEKYIEKNYNA